MKTKLLLSLEEIMQKWLDEHCEDDEWPSAYCYIDLARDMSIAAQLVFDSSIKGQEFLENEKGEKI